jgi:hypothetical protein
MAKERRSPRPPAVSVVVLIFLLQTVVFVTLLALQLAGLGVARVETIGTYLLGAWVQGDRWIDAVLIAGMAVLAAVSVVVTIGLARVRPWAWLWAMTVLGLRLLVGLIAYFRGDLYTFTLLVSVVAVLLLDQEPVRRAFGVTGELHA